MKKWMITLIGLTFTLAVAGIVTGFTLNAGSGEPAQDPTATSIDDIDPNVCNAIHNINACTPEELEDLGVAPHGDPTYDDWLSDFGDGRVVTSIDNVDPNACDYIHNINACTAEELEELGNLAAISWIVDPDTVVEGEPEPPFVDGEPVTNQECDLAGGTFWASSDGKVGCDIVNDPEDGGEGETQAQPPVVIPQVDPSA